MDSIVVIGGGAAGLMTAYELSKHTKKITLLEAKKRLGGRIHAISGNGFLQPVELGAEFIHGDLPHTISILKEAGIKFHETSGKMLRLEKGKLKNEKSFSWDWMKSVQKMKGLEQDMTLDEFLNTFFGDEKDAELRESLKGFAGGFDLAESSNASVKNLLREWSEEFGAQYRIDGGYQKLIDFLETECRKNGVAINTDCCVKKISWQTNEVNIATMCSRLFKCDKVIIAVPLGVLKAATNDENYIEFSPAIPEHIAAAKNIGYGSVIKLLFQFNENFWAEKKKDIGFILTNEIIPTWWTQLPTENNLLTGWVGGDKAKSLEEKSDEELLGLGLQSLSNAFDISVEVLKAKLTAYKIVNWNIEPDIAGGYSYSMVDSENAKKILRQPVQETLFFAGEALFEGTPVGTVEAALTNGSNVAQEVLKSLK